MLRGTWEGNIASTGDGEEATEFRLENLQAVQTGPATYRFQGDVRFGLSEQLADIAGTGTADPPFAPSGGSAVAPQMSPPSGPRYSFEATITSADGALLWELEGANVAGVNGQDGVAIGADGVARPLAVSPLGDGWHVMAFRTEPTTLHEGQHFDVVWSGWSSDELDVRCELFSGTGERIDVPDCLNGNKRVTMYLPAHDPPITSPAVLGVVLELMWGDGFGADDSYTIDVPVLPAPTP